MLKARIETALGALAFILTVVTIIWPTWIELLFGADPDGGSGETEWWIALIFAAAAAALLIAGRVHYKQARRLTLEAG